MFRHTMRVMPFAMFPILLIAAACGSTAPTDVEDVEVLGIVKFHDEPVSIQLPDSVDAGVPFTIRVRTWGTGCVSKGPTRVDVDGSVVRVEPIDTLGLATFCTAALQTFTHEADVSLGSPGEAMVRVIGRSIPEDQVVTFERTLVVR